MTTLATTPSTGAFDEPEGMAPRGTLVLLTGRGESVATYGRFGRRLAADAFRVRVVPTDPGDLDGARAEALAVLGAADDGRPVTLVGSDAGASVAALLARELEVDGVVLVGPVLSAPETEVSSWEDELEARTACPTHRGVLGRDAHFTRGALGEPLPAGLREAFAAPLDLPTLVVHGTADPFASTEAVRALVATLPRGAGVLVPGGRHDVLNDVTHRSVAASVVLFLEQLRGGPDAAPLVELVGLGQR